jgi:Integrase core domain/Integrase zinc binding domain
VFESLHQLAQLGTRATRRLIGARFVWRGMAKDSTEWCRECQRCARGKILTHVKSPVLDIKVPSTRFSHVHLDIVGPFPKTPEGHTHLITMIDRTTRWPEVSLLQSITATECADAFVATWVARFGVPATITTDRGTQFTSAVWSCLCRTLHPQSNGMIERFHRQLKEALRSRQCGTAWAEHVPWVLLGLRAAPKEESGVSAAEAVYAQPLVLPNQFQPPEGQSPPQSPQQPSSLPSLSVTESVRPRTYADVVAALPKQLMEADFVYIRKGPAGGPFLPPYSGPYKVLVKKDKVFEIQVGTRVESVSVDRLKAHRGGSNVVPATPGRAAVPVRRLRRHHWRRAM